MRKLTLLVVLSVLIWSCGDSDNSDKASNENSANTTSVVTPNKAVKATIEKMLGHSQPIDGAVLTGEELIITWPVVLNKADKVIARFREVGNNEWQVLVAKDGSIKVDGLETGKNYQYQLVAEFESKTIEGTVCNVTLQKGPRFVKHASTFSIPRDYQVRRSVEVINPTDSAQQIFLDVANSSDDLIVGFVGSGSTDLVMEIPAGETVPVSLLFFAQDAKPGEHKCVIRMQVAGSSPLITDNATAQITVAKPNFSLSISTGSVDPLTLATEIRVINNGDMLTDFDIVPVGAKANRVRCVPWIEHARLGAGDVIGFRLQPILRPREKEFTCELELRAAGQSTRMQVSFKVPENKQVFVGLTHSTTSSSATGEFCTNKPDFNSDMEGDGNGPYPFFKKFKKLFKKSNWDAYEGAPCMGIRGGVVRSLVAKQYPDLEKNNLNTAHALTGASASGGGAIVWHHINDDGNQEVSFAAMSAKGETDGPVNLSSAIGNSRWPTIGGSLDGTMLVVWEDDRDGKEMELYMSRSTDEGKSWTDPERLTAHTSGAYDPILWQQGKTWMVAWEDGRGGIYTRHSDNDGKSWQKEVRISGGTAAWPILAGKEDNVWCIWRDSTVVNIANSSDMGNSWSDPTQLSESERQAGEPTIVVAENNVFTAWRSEKEGNSDIMFRAFVDGSWSSAVNVTADPVMSEYPVLAVNGADLYLGYVSSSLGHASGYSRLSPDGGKTWDPARREARLNPNLTQAFLVVNFDLPWDRSTYRKHNVDILVNGHQVAGLIDVIPEGRYVFPVDPTMLNYVPGGVSNNNIHFSTRHMNGGHYLIAADFKIIHFLTYQERNVVATSQEEADRLLQAKFDDYINHDRPDAAIYANLINGLPENTDEKQTINLEVKVSNVGPVPLRGGQLECMMITEEGEIPLCDSITFGEIDPGRSLAVPLTFEHDGIPKRVAIRVVADGPDADLANDVHILRLGMLDHGFLVVESDSVADYKLIVPLTGEERAKVKSGELSKLPVGVYDLIDADGKRVLPNLSIRGGETTHADPGLTGVVEVSAYKNVGLTFTSAEGETITGSSNEDLRLPTGFYTVEAKNMTIPNIIIRRGKHIIVEAIAKGKIYVDYIEHGADVWVYDIHGNEVSSGWTNGSAGGIRPVSPGTYTVATSVAKMENVPVRSGETTKIDLKGAGRLRVVMEMDGKPSGKNTQYFVSKLNGERITLNFLGKEVLLSNGNFYTVTCMGNTWENVEIKDGELTELQVSGFGTISVWPNHSNYYYVVYDGEGEKVLSNYTNYTSFIKAGSYNVTVEKDYKVLLKTKVTIEENKTTTVSKK